MSPKYVYLPTTELPVIGWPFQLGAPTRELSNTASIVAPPEFCPLLETIPVLEASGSAEYPWSTSP